MSRLKELRLHGFKSFADPTRFVFEPGVNAVLGPNGSGKSNMADAVRWVLGEQSNRSLRTRRADDVIFAGSEGRRPQGMAEVVLTLDNADGWLPIEFSEVSVGRRAYRSGDSEYLINGARARLRDVVDLLGEGRLGANELVVVGQGTVDAALSLRPEERRQLFEEAAGVKGLQVKRNEASARLARALDNLTRVGDLIAELKPQARRLALQAEHQQQHDTLGARAHALIGMTHRRREQVARASLGEARRAAAAAEAALEAFRASEAAGREAIAAAEARFWEADDAARTAERARQATREELIRAEGRLEAADARLVDLERRLERESAALADAERALAARVTDTAERDIAEAIARSDEADAAWRRSLAALAIADDTVLRAEEAVSALRAREAERLASVARSTDERSRRESRREQIAAEQDEAARAAEAAREALRAADDDLTAATTRLASAREGLGAAERLRDAAQADADRAAQRVVELGERTRALRAEIGALAVATDVPRSLSRQLAASGWRAVLDAVDAPDDAWAAVEAVLGGELEAALLWSGSDPAAHISEARGAARLVATDGEADEARRADALRSVGGERTLDEWLGIRAAPGIFRRTVIASSVGALLDGWRALPPGWAAVTAEGDHADARGLVVLRGRAEPPGGAVARAHVRRRELEELLATSEAALVDAQRDARSATEGLRAARGAHLAASETEEVASAGVRGMRDTRHAAESVAARSVERLAALRAELELLADGSDQSADDEADGGATVIDELAALQAAADRARAERDARAADRDAARERWTAARSAAQAFETMTLDARRDRAAREALVSQLRASVPATRAAIGDARADRLRLAEVVRDAVERDGAAVVAVEAAEAARATCRAELVAAEGAVAGSAGRLADLERASQAAAVEASRRDEALAALARERELAIEGLPPADPESAIEALDELSDDDLEAELRRVRRTLGQIGSVNPFAVEEHREVADRLTEMTAQDTDLRSAIDATQELITRLDEEVASRFHAAFRAIGERFDEYCGLLFAGGSGSLTMGEAEDGDSAGGIEIVVRPPGKRLQRLGMLSGGERALTGVALLFAMLTVNPVPFCILDEVDAALDEANIGRFASALRRLSESIDFVVITHNRATIEVADTIYGVTMTDAAVSRVLSLRLADVPAGVVA